MRLSATERTYSISPILLHALYFNYVLLHSMMTIDTLLTK